MLFLYIEGFPYGGLLDAYREEHGCARRGVVPASTSASASAKSNAGTSAPSASDRGSDGPVSPCAAVDDQSVSQSSIKRIAVGDGPRPSGDDPGGYVCDQCFCQNEYW